MMKSIQSRYMSDPLLSDIDLKNKMAWVRTTLKWTQYWTCVSEGLEFSRLVILRWRERGL